MDKKVKSKVYTNPYDTIRQLDGATHLEVQYFLPYLKAWLPEDHDPMLADMNSICASPVSYTHLTLPTTPYV